MNMKLITSMMTYTKTHFIVLLKAIHSIFFLSFSTYSLYLKSHLCNFHWLIQTVLSQQLEKQKDYVHEQNVSNFYHLGMLCGFRAFLYSCMRHGFLQFKTCFLYSQLPFSQNVSSIAYCFKQEAMIYSPFEAKYNRLLRPRDSGISHPELQLS